jgi:hypothetical protein
MQHKQRFKEGFPDGFSNFFQKWGKLGEFSKLNNSCLAYSCLNASDGRNSLWRDFLAGVGFSDSESLDMTETTKNKKR